MQTLNLKQLEAFCAVVERGSFTAAAEALYLAQSTVSGHILALEKDIGVPLLVRSGKRRITLTEEGRRVYDHAHTILQSCAELSRELEEQTSREVSLAASSIPMQYILPQLISEFHRENSDFRFLLRSGDSAAVHAADAAAKEGTLELPRSYTIHSGVPVGKWLELQRQVQAGQRPGRLTVEQAAKLEKLGIRWNHRLETAWEKGFASAQKYRTEHGDLLVPVRYRDKNDFALGEWIVYNRQRYLGGNLTQNRIERLEAIGMVWSTSNDLWEQNYAAATQYYLEHGDLEVPIKYETPSGFGLGVWLGAQRAAHKAGELPQEQLERLDALGMDWTNRNDRKWMSLYDVAAAYYHEHGNLNVPSEYVTPDGVLLGKWVARQRYAYLNPDRSSARVTPERKALLDKLGMVWEKYDPWQERYDLALAYKTEHGDLEIPSVYKTADGVWLGSWVNRQRQALNSGSSALSSERRKLLRTLFKGERRPSDPAADHGTVREANWERNFRSAARYARKYKHLLVPASYVDSDGVRLGVWISNLRAARKNRPDSYQVTPAHIKKLNSIGMVWDARDAKWGTAYQQAKAYYKAHGNLHAAANYKSDETGFCLGDWLRRMREWDITHDPKLTPERRAMLDKIGMEWSE